MPDLDDFLDQLPLSQNERNIISFKNVLGLLNTTTFNTLLSQEKIAKSFNIYNDDILSDTVNNAFTSQQLSFLKQREWSLTSPDTPAPGIPLVPQLSPTETTPDELGTGGVSNPNVEKIIIPLTKVSETNDQLYVAYNPSFYVDSDGNNLFAAPQSEHSYNTSGDNAVQEGQISVIADTQENILNNFINPAKFGAGYTVEIFECTAGGTTISTNKIDEFASTSTNKKHGGYAFDYKEGAVLFGVNSDGTSPNLSGYNHPLFLVAYRYIGETGVGNFSLSGSGVVSESSQLTLNPILNESNQLVFTSTGESVDLASATELQARIEFGTLPSDANPFTGPSHFARDDIRLSSSILIKADADSEGKPYVSSSGKHGLFVNTVHGSDLGVADLGYFIGFSSSLDNPYRVSMDIDEPNSTPSFQVTCGTVMKLPQDIQIYQLPDGTFDNDTRDQALYQINTHIRVMSGSLSTKRKNLLNKRGFRSSSATFRFAPFNTEEFFYGIDHGVGELSGFTFNDPPPFYYSGLEYDPSGKTKEQIASGLKDFINENCSQHVSASVTIENGIPRLQVEQVYAGFPTNPYLNPHRIHYTSSATNGLSSIAGLSIVPTIFHHSSSNAQNSANQLNMTSSAGNFTASLVISEEHTCTGSNFYNTSTRTDQNRWSGDVVGSEDRQVFGFTIQGVQPDLGPSIQWNRNSPALSSGTNKGLFLTPIITQSGRPFNTDITLINNKVGPVNPQAATIANEIVRTLPFINQQQAYFQASDANASQIPTFVGFFDQETRFVPKSKELPFPTFEIRSGSFESTKEPFTNKENSNTVFLSKYSQDNIGGQIIIVNQFAGQGRSSTAEAFPNHFAPVSVADEFVDITVTGDATIGGTLTLAQSTLNVTSSQAVSASYALSASHIIGGAQTGVTSYTALNDIPEGIISSSEQIASDISGSWQGFISGSGIISSSEQIASDISGSFLGYLSGSGIVSNSLQFTNTDDVEFRNITASIISASNKIITGELTASFISASKISSSDLKITNDAQIDGDLIVDGTLTYEGFNFVSSDIAELTGSNTFGSTASLNQHTFTGSVIISSSQTNAFEIIGNVNANGVVKTNELITKFVDGGNFVNFGQSFLKNNVYLGSYNNSINPGTKVFIEAFSSVHPYAHIIAGKDDEDTSSGFKFQTRDVNGFLQDHLTLDADTQFGRLATFEGNVSASNFSAMNDIIALGNISGSNISASHDLYVGGNITASGNITGDDNTIISNIHRIETDVISSDANISTQIQLGNNQINVLVADTDVFSVNSTQFLFEQNLKSVSVVPPLTASIISASGPISASSLHLTGSNPYIFIGSTSTAPTNPVNNLYNQNGNLYWGNSIVGNASGLTGLTLIDDPNPTLGANLNLNGQFIQNDPVIQGGGIIIYGAGGNIGIGEGGFVQSHGDFNYFNTSATLGFSVTSNIIELNGPVTASIISSSDIEVGCLHANQITASNATINTLTGDNINYQNLVVNATVVNGGITVETPGEIGDPEVYQNFPHGKLLFLNDSADNLSNFIPGQFGIVNTAGYFSTSASLVDGDVNTANAANITTGEILTGDLSLDNIGFNFELISELFPATIQNSALNIIWDFETPVLLDSFRIDFSSQKGARVANAFKFIEIFGSNQPYLENVSGIGPGTNVTTGEYTLVGQTGQLLNRIEVNPTVAIDFLGNPIFSNNLSSATTVVAGQEITASNIDLGNALGEGVDASLNQTYRYYRLRFSASLEGAPQNLQLFREITPVTRSFTTSTFEITSDCVSVCSASVAISASHALTASHALNVQDAEPFPFIGDAEITGSLEVMTPGEVTSIVTTNTVDVIELIDTNITAIQNFTSSHQVNVFSGDAIQTINGGVYPYAIVGCRGNTGLPLTTPEIGISDLPSGEYAPMHYNETPLNGFSLYGRWDVTNNGPNNTFNPGAAASLNMFEDTESYIEFNFSKLNNELNGVSFGTDINFLAIDFDFFDYLGFAPVITKVEITFPDNYGANRFVVIATNTEQSHFTPAGGGIIAGAGAEIFDNSGGFVNGPPGLIINDNNTTVNNSITVLLNNDDPYKRYQIYFPPATFGLNPYFQNTESDIKLRIQNIKFFQKITTTETTEEIIYGDGSLVSILSGSVTASNGFHGTASNAISSSYAVSASHATFADFALNASGEDDDWFIETKYITSSRDVHITGNLFISTSGNGIGTSLNNSNGVYLNRVKALGLHNEGDKDISLKIGEMNSSNGYVTPPDNIIFSTKNGQVFKLLGGASLSNKTFFTAKEFNISNGSDFSRVNIIGELTSSRGLNANLKEKPFNHVVLYDPIDDSLYYTSSNALPGDDDWFIGNGYLTSSRNVHITKSLFVSENATIGNNTITQLFTSSRAIVQSSLAVGVKSTTNTLDLTQAPLVVADKLFVANTQDQDNPIQEGLIISTHGDNNITGGRIFFKNRGNNVDGLSLIYNAGTANSILNLPANSFNIQKHDNNTNGKSLFTVDISNERVGINETQPTVELDVRGDAHISRDLLVGRDITSSNDIIAFGDIIARGNVIAEQYVISSSVLHFTQSFSSGSTRFGDTFDDTHQFTGSVFISHSLTVPNLIVDILSASFLHVTKDAFISGNLQVHDDTFISGNLLVSGDLQVHDITASGNISASGYISASHFAGSGSGLVGVPIFVTGSSGEVDNVDDPILYVSRSFQRLHFDYHTGIHVSESAPDTAFISLGSAFHHFSASNGIAKATGSDLIIFEGLNGTTIEVTHPSQDGITEPHHKITFSGGRGFPYSGSDFIDNNPPIAVITGSLLLSGSGHVSASGNIFGKRAFIEDDFNAFNASSTRPVLTIKNKGGFGGEGASDNADAFIKFEADRSNSHYSVGIDSHDGDFKITSASTLNENEAGSTGFPTFRIQDNKVGIVKGGTVGHTLDVGGDINADGIVYTNTIDGTSFPNIGLSIIGNITASNDISASGDIFCNNLNFSGFTFAENILAVLTGSNSFGSTASFDTHKFTGSVFISSSQTNALNIIGISGSTTLAISPDGHITSSGDISASGHLYANLTPAATALGYPFEENEETFLRTVLYDSQSGEFYYTSSRVGEGDNLGNHTATANLNMDFFNIDKVSEISASSAILVGNTENKFFIERNKITNAPQIFSFREGGKPSFIGLPGYDVDTDNIQINATNITASNSYQIGFTNEGESSQLLLASASISNNNIVLQIGGGNKYTKIAGHITASGMDGGSNISASGNLIADELFLKKSSSKSEDIHIFHGPSRLQDGPDNCLVIKTGFDGDFNEGKDIHIVGGTTYESSKPGIHLDGLKGSVGIGTAAPGIPGALSVGTSVSASKFVSKDHDLANVGTVISAETDPETGELLQNQINDEFMVFGEKSIIIRRNSTFDLPFFDAPNPNSDPMNFFGLTELHSIQFNGNISCSSHIRTRGHIVSDTHGSVHKDFYVGANLFIGTAPTDPSDTTNSVDIGETSGVRIASSDVSASGDVRAKDNIWGKQRETTFHNHFPIDQGSNPYFLPVTTFIEQSATIATGQDQSNVKVQFVAPYDGKIIKLMYNAKGQSGTGVGGTDGLGTIRCNLFVNDIDRGEVNNGPATQFNTLPIIFDPNHPQFEEGNVLDQFYTANQLSNHGLQNTFKEGDLIKIRIDTNVNIEQAMCSLVWEYDYFI